MLPLVLRGVPRQLGAQLPPPASGHATARQQQQQQEQLRLRYSTSALGSNNVSRLINAAEATTDNQKRLPLSSPSVRMSSSTTLTLDNMNPAIIKMEYAVRGPLVIRATEIEKELEKVRD